MPIKDLHLRRQLDVWIPTLYREITPPKRRALSPRQQAELEFQTASWLASGVVEKAPPLPWTNNTVHVAKKDGRVRVCLDCTPSNLATKDYDWPLPKLQDIRLRLKGDKWFSRIDLKDAFFRLKVPRHWRHLVAFTSQGTDYWFTRMPFGLSTAPSHFQRFMDHTLAPLKGIALWYMDDILVSSKTRAGLREAVARVKSVLMSAGCDISEAKSEYDKESLLFAGIWITGHSVGPNHRKVRELLAVPTPRTKPEKQSALGLVSYLRDHIPLASLLTATLQPGANTVPLPPEEFEEQWQRLVKHVATSITTLARWDEELDADLYTDASREGCAAVLIQDGRIVALASRKLSPAETRYSATDREALGLLLAAQRMRVFLHRDRGITRVHTDHSALLTRKTTEMTPRQARWHTIISIWIPNAQHVRGKINPADFFSRWNLEIFGGQLCV